MRNGATAMPNILISASKSGAANYEAAIRALGGQCAAGYCPAADASYDGLLLAGGADVDPSRFGQENRGAVEIDQDRDQAEFALIRAYLAAGKPILGICRGLQILNIALGGSLIQDLPEPVKFFHTYDSERETERVHPVHAAPGSWFEEAWGKVFPVNSHHHQAVERLGQGLIPLLWSEGGVVEGMIHKSLPILCVQFHPERMSFEHRRADTVDGAPIFVRFLRMCGK